MSIAIFTDSTASIPKEYVEKYAIQVVPQVIIWNGQTFFDEIDMTTDEFYERLPKEKNLPTTSQASAGTFKELFDPYVRQGTPILGLYVSAGLSGTYQSAMQAKAEFPGAQLEVFDSKGAAMTLGFQVLAAARMVEQGKNIQEILATLDTLKENCGVIFVVDTLEYLHKGGRMSGTKRLLGTVLNLKPLLHLQDGHIKLLESVRTKKKAVARMLDIIEERISGKDFVRLSPLHAAAPNEAVELLDKLTRRFDSVEMIPSVVGPVIGTHVGPGTIGVAYSTGF